MQMHYIEIAEDQSSAILFYDVLVSYSCSTILLISFTVLTLFLVVEHAKVGGIA